jgi:outer membrane protein assembly factor BamB
VICPVCEKPNPAGTLHCQHCWGASLYAVTPITDEELAIVTARIEARDRRRNRLKVISVAAGAPLLLLLVIFLIIYSFTDAVLPPNEALSSSPGEGEQTMFRYDLGRTGAVNPDAAPPAGNVKWSFETNGPIHSSATVVDGTVYFGSQDFGLYAVDAETGRQRWVFRADTWIQSSPAVVDGVVYVGSNDGHMYAIDALTGAEIWRFSTFFPIKSSPAIVDDLIFFGSDDYSIYCLEAKTGKKVWEYRTGGWVMSSPVVAEGILYIGSMDQFIYALQADTGRFRLRVRTGEVQSSPAVQDEIVYFTSRGAFFAIDGKARNWPGEQDMRSWWLQFYAFRIAPPPPPISGRLWSTSLSVLPWMRRQTVSAPIVTGNTAYLTADDLMFAIDLDTHSIIWTYWASGDLRQSSPALGNGVLYVGSENGSLYAVNAADGHDLWSFETGGKVTASPTLVDGIVYVGSHDGTVYAIE